MENIKENVNVNENVNENINENINAIDENVCNEVKIDVFEANQERRDDSELDSMLSGLDSVVNNFETVKAEKGQMVLDPVSKQERKDFFRLKRQEIAKKVSTLRIDRKYGTITKESDAYITNIDDIVALLKELVLEKKMVNIGYGVEKAFDISSEDLEVVFYLLEESGYRIYRGNDGGKKLRILTTSSIQYKEIFNTDKIFGLKSVFNRFKIGKGSIGTITIKQAVASNSGFPPEMPKATTEKISKIKIIKADTLLDYFGLSVGTICDVDDCLLNDSYQIYKYVITIDHCTSMGIPWWYAEAYVCPEQIVIAAEN